MNIRKMDIRDYQQVYDLWASDGNVGLRNLDDSLEGINKFLKRNPDTNFIAEKDGKIVGAILCGHDGRRAYIYHAFVKPTSRRNGVGEALVNEVLAVLDKIGITKVALTVFTSNELGNQFWDKMGFIKRPDLYYRNRTLNAENE